MRGLFLSVLCLAWIGGGAGLVRAQDDARALVVKAVQAHGGEEKLSKLLADRVQIKGKLYQGDQDVPFTGEMLVQLPGRFKNIADVKIMGRTRHIVQALNGDRAWISIDGQTSDANADTLAQMKELLYLDELVRLTPLLKDKEYQLTPLKESKFKDRPVMGIKVASKGHRDASLWFDKETGLLVKAESTTINNQKKEVSQEQEFSDFKDIGGIKRPMKVVTYQDGKKLIEAEITDVKLPDKIADSEFAKP